MNRVYNFSAGPSMLPVSVLNKAAAEMLNYEGSGQSVMEMSHRSKVYDAIIKGAEELLREVMQIPDNYKVLFLQGGASSQFAMVPLNLIGRTGKADYALTGHFSTSAAKEAKKYGSVHIAADQEALAVTLTNCDDQAAGAHTLGLIAHLLQLLFNISRGYGQVKTGLGILMQVSSVGNQSILDGQSFV